MSFTENNADIYKHVDFNNYCGKCSHSKKEGTDEPCNSCLDIPARPYSRIPEYYDGTLEVTPRAKGMPTSLRRVGEFLYRADYADVDYEAAKSYLKKDADIIAPLGACSAFKDDGKFYRNFDWKYDNSAEFIVDVQPPKDTSRCRTRGICGGITEFTEAFVKDNNNDNNELYRILPFLMRDGMNEYGLFAEINVVPTWDTDNKNTSVPTIKTVEEISALMVVRYVLDHFVTAKAACRYLNKFVSIYFPKSLHNMGYECHWLIGDANEVYCLEIINNTVEMIDITDRPYLTNFHLYDVVFNDNGTVYTPSNQDSEHNAVITNHIHPFGSGLERYNFIVRAISLARGGWILEQLKYTNAYSYDTGWLTEFTGTNGLRVDSEPEEFNDTVGSAIEKFEERSRDTGETWHTCHSVVYNPARYTMVIHPQENFYEDEGGVMDNI